MPEWQLASHAPARSAGEHVYFGTGTHLEEVQVRQSTRVYVYRAAF